MANSLLKELLQPSVEQHEEETTGYGIDTIEYASLEMAEVASDLERHEQAVVELEEIAAGLESIAESMEASLEQGGMDPVAAQFAHHAVGAYTERLGMEAADQLPALEAFGGDTGRQTSTQVSLESVKERAAQIFEAIRRAIEAVIKAVGDFFTQFFSNAEKLGKAVEATIKKVDEAKGSPKGKVRVPNVDTIGFKGSAAISEITKGIKATDNVYKVMSGEYLDTVSKGQKELAGLLSKNVSAETMEAFRSAFTRYSTWAKDMKQSADKAEGEVSGGRAITVEVKGEGDSVETEIKFDKVEGAKKIDNNEIDTPNAADLKAMLGAAKDLAGSLKASEGAVKKAMDAYREAAKAANDLAKDAKGGKLGEAWNNVKSKWLANRTSKNLVSPVQRLSSHSWSVTRGAISVAEASLKNYSEGDK